jgi:hypothetical protein
MIDLRSLGPFKIATVRKVECIACDHGYIVAQKGDTLLAFAPMRDRKGIERAHQLARHGLQVGDCSTGELVLQFDPKKFRDVAAVLLPLPVEVEQPTTTESTAS